MDTALCNAACNGSAERVQQLINERANINLNYNAKTPLHYAASNKHVDCLRILIDNGGDINSRSWKDETTVLHRAAEGGSIECMQLLIDRGADVHAKAENGWTAFHFAACGGDTQCIQLLYELGVDIDAKHNDGKLHMILPGNMDSTMQPSYRRHLVSLKQIHPSRMRSWLQHSMVMPINYNT